MNSTKWPIFVPLTVLLLVAIFIVGFLPVTADKTSLFTPYQARSVQTSWMTFLLTAKQNKENVEIDVKVESPSEDLAGFSLSLNYNGSGSAQIKTNPQLGETGWQFPVQKFQEGKINLAAIHTTKEKSSFETKTTVATIIIKTSAFKQSDLELNSNLTKVINKNGQFLTPNLKWEKS